MFFNAVIFGTYLVRAGEELIMTQPDREGKARKVPLYCPEDVVIPEIKPGTPVAVEVFTGQKKGKNMFAVVQAVKVKSA